MILALKIHFKSFTFELFVTVFWVCVNQEKCMYQEKCRFHIGFDERIASWKKDRIVWVMVIFLLQSASDFQIREKMNLITQRNQFFLYSKTHNSQSSDNHSFTFVSIYISFENLIAMGLAAYLCEELVFLNY